MKCMKFPAFKPNSIIKRFYHEDTKTLVRQAQSIETFRSRFYENAKSDVSVSINDIDDLVKANQVRPSILLAGFECLGSTTGTLYKYSPTFVKSYIDSGVNQAVSDQFNNSIRELQHDETTNTKPVHEVEFADDVKETIKYHRDVFINRDTPTEGSSNSNGFINSTTNIVSLGLNTLFAISKKL